jgi:16S rRNA processing protein RimM
MEPDKSAEANARQSPEFLTVGRIIRPHGIRGGVLVEAGSELIHDISTDQRVYIGDRRKPLLVKSLRRHRGQFILYFEGIEDRNSAEALRDLALAISFQSAPDLPEGTYFHWQILGLDVESDTGEYLGRISKILETGANDVYIVSSDVGELLLPAIKEVVLDVDLKNKRMIVHLIPGLMD